MAMPESLIHEWDQLNESNRRQAHLYIRLLLKQQDEAAIRINPTRKLGILSHRFHGITDDFNDPLLEFREYMP